MDFKSHLGGSQILLKFKFINAVVTATNTILFASMCIQLQHNTIITQRNGFNDGVHYHFWVRSLCSKRAPFWLMRRHFLDVMSFYQCCQIGIFLGDSSAGQRLVHAAKEATTALKLEAHITSLEAALQIKINASKQFRIFAVESSMMAFFTVRCQMGSKMRKMSALLEL